MKLTVNINDMRVVEGFLNEEPTIVAFLQIYELGIELKHIFKSRNDAMIFLKKLLTKCDILGDIEINLKNWKKINEKEIDEVSLKQYSDFNQLMLEIVNDITYTKSLKFAK